MEASRGTPLAEKSRNEKPGVAASVSREDVVLAEPVVHATAGKTFELLAILTNAPAEVLRKCLTFSDSWDRFPAGKRDRGEEKYADRDASA